MSLSKLPLTSQSLHFCICEARDIHVICTLALVVVRTYRVNVGHRSSVEPGSLQELNGQ